MWKETIRTFAGIGYIDILGHGVMAVMWVRVRRRPTKTTFPVLTSSAQGLSVERLRSSIYIEKSAVIPRSIFEGLTDEHQHERGLFVATTMNPIAHPPSHRLRLHLYTIP